MRFTLDLYPHLHPNSSKIRCTLMLSMGIFEGAKNGNEISGKS